MLCCRVHLPKYARNLVSNVLRRVAQSPFGRATSTLGDNKNANTLRKALEARGMAPEHCNALTLAAYGPLYDASDTENYMEHWHKVRALERALLTC